MAIMSCWVTTQDGILAMKLTVPPISCVVNGIVLIVREVLSGL